MKLLIYFENNKKGNTFLDLEPLSNLKNKVLQGHIRGKY